MIEKTEQRSILASSLTRRIGKLIAIDDILKQNSFTSNDRKLHESHVSHSNSPMLCIEPRKQTRPLSNQSSNWLDEFRSKTRKDRVKWDSKLHQFVRRFSAKTTYEQTDELMDIAANEFAEWINKLSNDEKNQIDKNTIKKLFSIGIEDDVSKSVCLRMIQKPVVPEEIAETFDCAELSIERNVQKMLDLDKKKLKAPTKHYAFGRSLSPTLRRSKPNDCALPMTFSFPEDIRSGKNLFKGIDHLKSCKALVNCLNEKNMQIPKYLHDVGAFNNATNVTTAANYIPLYLNINLK